MPTTMQAFASPVLARFGGPVSDSTSSTNGRRLDAYPAHARRVRALMYGAGGAFRGLAQRSFSSGINNGGRRGGRDDDHNDDGNVDPSWGAAPGVHVVLRERCDEVYRTAVANLIQMSAALSMPSFVSPTDATVPVVIMLSWMGAQQKHLTKYTKFYEDLGYEVHCFFNGLRTAIFPPASKAQAKRIQAFIDDQPDGRPVFVHAFSIGTGIYGLILDNLRNDIEKLDRLKSRIAGVVFDSGPAPIFPNDVAKGLHTVCPMVSKAVWEPVAGLFFFVTKARQAFSRSEEALRKLQLPSPQLYFYSLDDKVIPNIHHAIEEFVEKNRQRGLEVYKKWWEKSTHASHLKVHPEEYLTNLDKFVRRCMDLHKQKETVDAPVAAAAS